MRICLGCNKKINFNQPNYYAVEKWKKGIVVFLIPIIAQDILIPKRVNWMYEYYKQKVYCNVTFV